MGLIDTLNKAQKEAVCQTEGPVMVMAGAGSGKTKVLTTRIAYLIDELGILPSNILAVTFTNKAAREMKDRIEKLIQIDTKYMWVSTFHSFCSRLLRIESANIAPYKTGFTIIDDEDSLKIVKQICKELDIDGIKPKELKNLISKSKNFTDFSISNPIIEDIYNKVNPRYQQYLIENNLLDFDDLIIITIKLFKTHPDILEKYQRKFEYILVDEFQDTNALQYSLMYMLAIRHHNIFVVGDDFQSIYSFRGAKIENISKFRKDFINHKLILLEQNYRSTAPILNLANDVIKKNPNQIKKVMFTDTKDGKLPIIYKATSAYDEVMFVIDTIKKLMAEGASYKDFAIMYRANYISRQFEDVLIKYQMPYKIYGGLSFFSRKEIKDVIAYIRLIVNHEDDFSFQRIINEPKRKIGPVLIEKLHDYAKQNNISLYNAIETYSLSTGMGVSNLRHFKEILDSISIQIENMKLSDLPQIIIDETGYHDMLKNDDLYDDRITNIYELKSVLKEVSENYDGTNLEKLEAFLADLSLRTDNESDDLENDDYIRLTTYHQSKGLEFENVFMCATEEEIFPSMNVYTQEDIEEERRICYVGITRAKKRLYITHAESRFLFGGERHLPASRFISEMDDELYLHLSTSKKIEKRKTFILPKNEPKKEEVKQLSNDDNKEITTGDKINHKAFGDGMVVSDTGSIITVAFGMPYGIKKLSKLHPSIRKI